MRLGISGAAKFIAQPLNSFTALAVHFVNALTTYTAYTNSYNGSFQLDLQLISSLCSCFHQEGLTTAYSSSLGN